LKTGLSKARVIMAVAAIFVLAVMIAIVLTWYRTLFSPLPMTQSMTIKVYPQTGIDALANDMHQRGLIEFPRILIKAARWSKKASQLKFGEYRIEPGQSAWQVLDQIIAGKGMVKHRITFIEGWTFARMKKALNDDPNIRHTLANKTDAQIMSTMHSSYSHPEGLFFPDTYQFVWGNRDVDILQHSYDKMQRFLSSQWRTRAKRLPYRDAYQALIVASLIEKETAVASERPKVAAVIVRRLKVRMRLQVDPTVLYGLNKPYGAPITKKDLRTKTPYNTYMVYGLPPTPIDMPSAASIKASMHPANIKALYYVSKGDGTHQFSMNYRAHLAAVKAFQEPLRLARKQREITIVIPLSMPSKTAATVGHFILEAIGIVHDVQY